MAATVRLKLNLFGGFRAQLDPDRAVTLSTRKAQALLGYLAARPGQAHPRDKLATLLWGEAGDTQARDSLRQTAALELPRWIERARNAEIA